MSSPYTASYRSTVTIHELSAIARLDAGDFKFTQLFYNYYAGKPRETKDITVSNEQPIFNIDLDEV